jgi:hypothetical protein
MLSSKTIIGYLVFAAVASVFYFYQSERQSTYLAVNSFDSCVSAGYELQITYPESCRTPDNRVFVNETQRSATSTVASPKKPASNPDSKENYIVVDSITPGQIIESPLHISGKARGFWFFEGSFPLELVDAQGKQITLKPVMAKGDWMTAEFVPFDMSFAFGETTATSGMLIFHKDNPSGGVMQSDSLKIPVRFNQQMRTVSLYLYDKTKDTDVTGNIKCSKDSVVPVLRDIPISKTPLQDTLALLFSGSVKSEEKARGLESLFPLNGLMVKTLTLTELGELLLTLKDPYNKSIGGACRVGILRAQLEQTMKQFDGIKSVIVKPDNLFQP